MPEHLSQRAQWLAAAQNSFELQQLLLEKCRRDILFWFDHFCWTFDPRLSQPHQPFVLYPYQRQVVLDLQNALEQKHDVLIEKSRDMGISWVILLLFQYYWLFRDGANFHLGSRKEDAVDRKGDISTLFEKLRYNLDWLPAWMKPPGYQGKLHDNLLRLINPANGNSMTGESSNENFGRGGRYRAVLFDEFPFWPGQDAAFASAGQSTPCRIIVGTPYGKNNRFAELRFSGQIEVVNIHWSQHPHKDSQWYDTQKTRMSEDELARELDINYNLSLKNRVFRNFSHENKAELSPLEGVRVVRSWDFGYHCPACLFIQMDADGWLLVLHEEVGQEDLLLDFAKRVLTASEQMFPPDLFPRELFEDICDPAGAQRSDKSTQTSIEILNSLKVYPYHDRTRIKDGLELIRMKLSERLGGQSDLSGRPGLLVDFRCEKLIEAFEGGYRYAQNGIELPLQEHPYEDVMDCLRYAVMAKCDIGGTGAQNRRKSSSVHRPRNHYTGY